MLSEDGFLNSRAVLCMSPFTMLRLIAVASKHAPHGESALPYLAVVLFVLLFVAWPLVDIGLLMRPLEMNQIVHADEVGALLPFGSTAFTPPLATLLAYFVDPDEDLV